MRIINARFNGRCCECGATIRKGATIGIVRKGAVCCSSCIEASSDAHVPLDEEEHDERDWPPSASVLASDARLARRGLTVVRFSSGAVMTQNSRGRCEDAPCCGCCS